MRIPPKSLPTFNTISPNAPSRGKYGPAHSRMISGASRPYEILMDLCQVDLPSLDGRLRSGNQGNGSLIYQVRAALDWKDRPEER